MIQEPPTIFFNKIDENYDFKFSYSIKELEEDWICVDAHTLYLTVPYLKALEKSVLKELEFIYLVIYHNQKVVGIVYFQRLVIGSSFFTQKKFPSKIHTKFSSKLLKSIKGNILLCGNFFATGVTGFSLKEELPKTLLPKTIEKLINVLTKQNPPLKVNFVLFKEFWKEECLETQYEIKKTYSIFEIDVHMMLEITWSSFDEYLAALTTKYRTRAKSVYKKTAEIVVKDFTGEDILAHQTTITELYQSVLDTASFNLVTLTKGSFYQLKKELKENFIFKGYFLENKLIAFSSACLHSDYLDATYVGLNYQINNVIPLYQRILYDYLQLALQKPHVKNLRLGRTAEIMKSGIGAKPYGMNLYVKHNNHILHKVLSPLLKYVIPSEYEIRNPYKKTALSVTKQT